MIIVMVKLVLIFIEVMEVAVTSENINHNNATVPVAVPLAKRVPREIFRDALRAINVENGAVL